MLSEEEKKAIDKMNKFARVSEDMTVITAKEMDIVLKLVEKLQKENESKEKAYNDCYCEYKHYKQYESIPKQVVKDKIKEIEEDKECYYYDWFLEERDIEKTINILEKILGDE